jgi:hypothetical protein
MSIVQEEYDTDLVCVKRDPAFHQLCMFVCKGVRMEDPSISTLVISDWLSKSLNQDQDGDKNGIYMLPKKKGRDWDYSQTHEFQVAKIELQKAMQSKMTLLASARCKMSEHCTLMSYRNRIRYAEADEFFRRTGHRGGKFMMDAGSSYMASEFKQFQKLIIADSAKKEYFAVTVDDVLLRTDVLESVVRSGAKGTMDSLAKLKKNLTTEEDPSVREEASLVQMQRYVHSARNLSQKGRRQFVSLYAANDLMVLLGNVSINKKFIANFRTFASAMETFAFNEASLTLFLEDLQRL